MGITGNDATGTFGRPDAVLFADPVDGPHTSTPSWNLKEEPEIAERLGTLTETPLTFLRQQALARMALALRAKGRRARELA